MDDLRKRFGRLLAAHRRRAGLTQGQLAERADISVDMISKIEIGVTGARFPVIERLSSALGIDPAELFTTEVSNSALKNGPMLDLVVTLAGLNREDQVWIKGVVEAALKGR
jgi:transcriptional regulator with XRE-family HTH domain